MRGVSNPANFFRNTDGNEFKKRQKTRLHPRAVAILLRLTEPGAKLVRGEGDGKYRVNGNPTRRDTVIERTKEALLRVGTLRTGFDGDLYITDRGRRIVKRYATVEGDILIVRAMRAEPCFDSVAAEMMRDAAAKYEDPRRSPGDMHRLLEQRYRAAA